MSRPTSNLDSATVFETLEARRFLSVSPFHAHSRGAARHHVSRHHVSRHAVHKVAAPLGPDLSVVSVSPSGDAPAPIAGVTVTFDRPVDPFSIQAGDFHLIAPDQSAIAADSATLDDTGTQLTIAFPSQSALGAYAFSISGATSLAGVDGSGMAPQPFSAAINLVAPGLTAPIITSGNYPTFHAAATPLCTVTWYVGGNAVGSSAADASGVASITLPEALSLGRYSLTAIAFDNAGHASALSTPFAFHVAAGASVGIDGTDPLKTELDVVGTDNGDHILIQYLGSQTRARVVINGRSSGPFNFSGRIVVHGLGGNDLIAVDQHFTVPTLLFGDADNNLIIGGGGPDDIIGGPGNDTLFGQAGNDTLRGNGGVDQLFGGDGQNQLT